jgi:hypothetical protein
MTGLPADHQQGIAVELVELANSSQASPGADAAEARLLGGH